MNTFTKAKKRLQECGIKPSLQRIAIMEYLMLNKTHPTTDMIFNDLHPKIPTLSKTTVYNTVKLLTEQGAILSINIDEKNQRYDGDISRHAHFRCKDCGCIYDLPVKRMKISHPKNNTDEFVITEAQLYYRGFCKKCA